MNKCAYCERFIRQKHPTIVYSHNKFVLLCERCTHISITLSQALKIKNWMHKE
jgi:ribosomal protein S27E